MITQPTPGVTRRSTPGAASAPGPLMELIRGIREAAGRRRHRRPLHGPRLQDSTSPSGWPRPATAWSALETRDGYDEIIVEKLR